MMGRDESQAGAHHHGGGAADDDHDDGWCILASKLHTILSLGSADGDERGEGGERERDWRDNEEVSSLPRSAAAELNVISS